MRLNKKSYLLLLLAMIVFCNFSLAQNKQKPTSDEKEKPKELLTSSILNGLQFRSIGPAFTSGRIADFAVNPLNHKEYYVAVACGNVWKTENAGITYQPIFDNYGSYSTASIVIDPRNTNVVWLGTGEYNSQRAIGWGDGIYLSEDAGKSWKNMGLKKSEHIGRVAIDPRNSHVYVAAQGPLWGDGGERGLYKTTDNGKTWNKILNISDKTGITDIVIDPRNPDILYCASYQRRRHVFTLIDGGPESAIYKSIDAGATWDKMTNGLPSGNVGRIGLAISPVNPDVVYAIIELPERKGGFYRTTNRGASWTKMSDHVSSSPQYYNRIFADPKNVDKVFSMNTVTAYTLDGGKTFINLGLKDRHVDDHAFWIDPDDTEHILIGGDGGIYESYDHGENWHHKGNLPVTQYYRVAVDDALPFYNVYGGTQDNNSMGGPSRTLSADGIVNSDWIVTTGGDGFQSRIEPGNPNIVYSQSQYGYLVRYDKQSDLAIGIQPQPPSNEAYRWNWNSPLIISPHSATRLYFAANKLFRSDDRGNTWKVISPDLTRQIDRNTLPVMGKIWGPEAVAKNASTSFFGNITALSESPKQDGYIIIGTDDGLIQITEDGGTNWRKVDKFAEVPETTYVSCVLASQHDPNVIFATFDGRKDNNLKPYILISNDKGKTWKSIINGLPERTTVYSIVEDHVKQGLLFAGTEFGVYVSFDNGNKWIQLKSGLPTIPVYDIAIQSRENDLVLATFGRGFYILDDYSPLRQISESAMSSECILFPVKDALMFNQTGDRYGQGASYYKAKNPEVGAVFTFYLKEGLKTKKQLRQDAEKEAEKKGLPIRYPTPEELLAEDEQEAPYLLFTVSDASGNVIRKIKESAKSGVNRVVWDFRYQQAGVTRENTAAFAGGNMVAMPGKYSVTIGKVVDNVYTQLAGPVNFNTVPLNNSTLPLNRTTVFEFGKQAGELAGTIQALNQITNQLMQKIKLIRVAISNTPTAPNSLNEKAVAIEQELKNLDRLMNGDESKSKRDENEPPAISERINRIAYSLWRSNSDPTQTMRDQYEIAKREIDPVYTRLKKLSEVEIPELEKGLEAANAPWTPGRFPVLKK